MNENDVYSDLDPLTAPFWTASASFQEGSPCLMSKQEWFFFFSFFLLFLLMQYLFILFFIRVVSLLLSVSKIVLVYVILMEYFAYSDALLLNALFFVCFS